MLSENWSLSLTFLVRLFRLSNLLSVLLFSLFSLLIKCETVSLNSISLGPKESATYHLADFEGYPGFINPLCSLNTSSKEIDVKLNTLENISKKFKLATSLNIAKPKEVILLNIVGSKLYTMTKDFMIEEAQISEASSDNPNNNEIPTNVALANKLSDPLFNCFYQYSHFLLCQTSDPDKTALVDTHTNTQRVYPFAIIRMRLFKSLKRAIFLGALFLRYCPYDGDDVVRSCTLLRPLVPKYEYDPESDFTPPYQYDKSPTASLLADLIPWNDFLTPVSNDFLPVYAMLIQKPFLTKVYPFFRVVTYVLRCESPNIGIVKCKVLHRLFNQFYSLDNLVLGKQPTGKTKEKQGASSLGATLTFKETFLGQYSYISLFCYDQLPKDQPNTDKRYFPGRNSSDSNCDLRLFLVDDIRIEEYFLEKLIDSPDTNGSLALKRASYYQAPQGCEVSGVFADDNLHLVQFRDRYDPYKPRQLAYCGHFLNSSHDQVTYYQEPDYLMIMNQKGVIFRRKTLEDEGRTLEISRVVKPSLIIGCNDVKTGQEKMTYNLKCQSKNANAKTSSFSLNFLVTCYQEYSTSLSPQESTIGNRIGIQNGFLYRHRFLIPYTTFQSNRFKLSLNLRTGSDSQDQTMAIRNCRRVLVVDSDLKVISQPLKLLSRSQILVQQNLLYGCFFNDRDSIPQIVCDTRSGKALQLNMKVSKVWSSAPGYLLGENSEGKIVFCAKNVCQYPIPEATDIGKVINGFFVDSDCVSGVRNFLILNQKDGHTNITGFFVGYQAIKIYTMFNLSVENNAPEFVNRFLWICPTVPDFFKVIASMKYKPGHFVVLVFPYSSPTYPEQISYFEDPNVLENEASPEYFQQYCFDTQDVLLNGTTQNQNDNLNSPVFLNYETKTSSSINTDHYLQYDEPPRTTPLNFVTHSNSHLYLSYSSKTPGQPGPYNLCLWNRTEVASSMSRLLHCFEETLKPVKLLVEKKGAFLELVDSSGQLEYRHISSVYIPFGLPSSIYLKRGYSLDFHERKGRSSGTGYDKILLFVVDSGGPFSLKLKNKIVPKKHASEHYSFNVQENVDIFGHIGDVKPLHEEALNVSSVFGKQTTLKNICPQIRRVKGFKANPEQSDLLIWGSHKELDRIIILCLVSFAQGPSIPTSTEILYLKLSLYDFHDNFFFMNNQSASNYFRAWFTQKSSVGSYYLNYECVKNQGPDNSIKGAINLGYERPLDMKIKAQGDNLVAAVEASAKTTVYVISPATKNHTIVSELPSIRSISFLNFNSQKDFSIIGKANSENESPTTLRSFYFKDGLDQNTRQEIQNDQRLKWSFGFSKTTCSVLPGGTNVGCLADTFSDSLFFMVYPNDFSTRISKNQIWKPPNRILYSPKVLFLPGNQILIYSLAKAKFRNSQENDSDVSEIFTLVMWKVNLENSGISFLFAEKPLSDYNITPISQDYLPFFHIHRDPSSGNLNLLLSTLESSFLWVPISLFREVTLQKSFDLPAMKQTWLEFCLLGEDPVRPNTNTNPSTNASTDFSPRQVSLAVLLGAESPPKPSPIVPTDLYAKHTILWTVVAGACLLLLIYSSWRYARRNKEEEYEEESESESEGGSQRDSQYRQSRESGYRGSQQSSEEDEHPDGYPGGYTGGYPDPDDYHEYQGEEDLEGYEGEEEEEEDSDNVTQVTEVK